MQAWAEQKPQWLSSAPADGEEETCLFGCPSPSARSRTEAASYSQAAFTEACFRGHSAQGRVLILSLRLQCEEHDTLVEGY